MGPTKVIGFKEGRYEGEVNAAGDPEGSGTLEYPGNDEFLRQFYEGEFVNKKAHGKGMMRWNQGDKYEGEWKEGLRHGRGKYTYPNKDVYNGNWNNGVRHGKGKYMYKEDEGVYEGEWVEGIKQGKGTYTFGS